MIDGENAIQIAFFTVVSLKTNSKIIFHFLFLSQANQFTRILRNVLLKTSNSLKMNKLG